MKFTFRKNKYGKELFVDCDQISTTKEFVKDQTPFYIPFHEIFFLTEGIGKFKIDTEEINFKKGTILLLPPNKWRQLYVINKAFDGYFLIFEEEFITNFFNDALFLYRLHYFYKTSTPSYIQLDDERFEKIMGKLHEIRIELQGLRSDSNHLLRSLLYYILIQINRLYESTYNLNDKLYEDNLALSFKKLLEKNIKSKQKVADYADLLKVSPSHLNKTLQKYYGKSCSQIIRERLIVEIKNELLFNDKSIAEIAYDLNFSEPSNFNRFFTKMIKLSPGRYRLLHSK